MSHYHTLTEHLQAKQIELAIHMSHYHTLTEHLQAKQI